MKRKQQASKKQRIRCPGCKRVLNPKGLANHKCKGT